MSSAVAVSTAADDEATAKYIVLNHVPGESQRQRLTFMEDDGKEIYQQQGQMDTSYLRAMGDEAADKQDKVRARAPRLAPADSTGSAYTQDALRSAPPSRTPHYQRAPQQARDGPNKQSARTQHHADRTADAVRDPALS